MYEREVKFYLQSQKAFQERLSAAGARLIHARTHEFNLRFDTPNRDLQRLHQVLRLRQDSRIRLTYKGPTEREAGIRERREIEVEVDDFAAARSLLEALGFRVSFIYEKFRTTYALLETEIVLDETPMGYFLEIEGPDRRRIESAAEALGLDWKRAIAKGYAQLFEIARTRLGLAFGDLTFENFAGISVRPSDLNVEPAD